MAEDTVNCPALDRHLHRFSHQYQCLAARDLQEGRLTVVTAMCTTTSTLPLAHAETRLPLMLGGPGRSTGASFSSLAPNPCKLPTEELAGPLPHPHSPILTLPYSFSIYTLIPSPSCFLFQLIAVPILPHHSISPVRIKVNVHNYYQDYNADFFKDKIILCSGKVQAEKRIREAST